MRDALLKLSKVIERKSAIPIMEMVLFESRPEGVFAIGSDLDMVMIARVEGASRFEGAFTASYRPLAEIARKATGESMTIGHYQFVNGEKSEAYCEPVSVTFHYAAPAKDFPDNYSHPTPAGSIDIEAVHLIAILKDCYPFVSREDTRYYLNGVYLHGGLAGLTAVATDGHRLACSTTPVVTSQGDVNAMLGGDAGGGVIVPTKAVMTLLATVKPRGMVRVEIMDSINFTPAVPPQPEKRGRKPGDAPIPAMPGKPEMKTAALRTWARFTYEGTTLMTKLIDGTFPAYKRVIPDVRGVVPLVINVGKVARAIDAIPLISRQSAAKLTTDDKLWIEYGSHEHSHYRVSADAIESGTLAASIGVSVSVRYLAEALRFVSGGSAEVVTKRKGDPIILRRVGETERFAIIMPMRT